MITTLTFPMHSQLLHSLLTDKFWWVFFDHLDPTSIPPPSVHPQHHHNNMSLMKGPPIPASSGCRHHNGALAKCLILVQGIPPNHANTVTLLLQTAITESASSTVHIGQAANITHPPGESVDDADDVRAWFGDTDEVPMDIDQMHMISPAQGHGDFVLPLPPPLH